MKNRDSELLRLRNLGPTSVRWLRAIGVNTEAELRSLGAVEAFGQISALLPGASLNLLYALHGALTDTHWVRLSAEDKAQLKQQALG